LRYAARPDRLYALWTVALSLGLRRFELLGLAWPGVDQGTLRVVQGVQRIGGALVLDELKSDRSHPNAPLPRVTVDALREHRTREAAERLRAGPQWAANDLRHGQPARRRHQPATPIRALKRQ